ncbi:unnamed protein product [Lactuca virosa]|uniref:Uncharacterized protein n=1 Tax=Lactuca virosa TaxID=75947 RepID=A0AAU9NQF3_9ASTR|nr:unnamed protein product [Lactuca virosa]
MVFLIWVKFVPAIRFRTNNEPFKASMQGFTQKIVRMMNAENMFESQEVQSSSHRFESGSARIFEPWHAEDESVHYKGTGKSSYTDPKNRVLQSMI